MAFDWDKYGVADPRLPGDGLAGGVQHNIDRLYQNIVGRNADSSGADYWKEQISSGRNTYDDLVRGLTNSQEYKDRLSAVQANPNITEGELDKLDSAYVSPFAAGSGSNVAGWTPDQPLTDAQAYSSANNFPDQTNQSVGQVNQANNVSGSSGGVSEIGTDPATESANYLTMDDLTQFFADRDAAASGNTSAGGMDDFFKFMMFMNMMRPQGGGYGGSQYGYGGLNPGGVMSAYNPMDNMQGMMDAFKSITTGLTNTGTT